MSPHASRFDEAGLVERCSQVAKGSTAVASDIREANVFRVAAMIVGPRRRAEAARLLRASDAYFAAQPSDRLQPAEVVRQGWVTGLPRLRQLLNEKLSR